MTLALLSYCICETEAHAQWNTIFALYFFPILLSVHGPLWRGCKMADIGHLLCEVNNQN